METFLTILETQGLSIVAIILAAIFFTYKLRKQNKFNLLFFKQTKWHEKKHEALTQIWKRVADSQTKLGTLINSFKVDPGLDSMDEESLNNFFKANRINASEKKRLLDAKNKNQKMEYVYYDILDDRYGDEAVKAMQISVKYFNQKKIFLDTQMDKKITEVHEKIWHVIISHYTFKYDTDKKVEKNPLVILKKEVEPLIKELEEMIREQLFPKE